MAMTFKVSSKGEHIIGYDVTYDEQGLELESSYAALAFDKSKLTAAEALALVKKGKWTIVKDDSGFGKLVRA